MTDQTKAPERIWVEDTAQGTERPNGVWDSWSHPSLVEFIRADIAAEQVREAREAILIALADIPHPESTDAAEALERAYRAAEVAADMPAGSVRSIKEAVREAYERATDQLADALGNIAAMGYSEDAAVAKNIARAAVDMARSARKDHFANALAPQPAQEAVPVALQVKPAVSPDDLIDLIGEFGREVYYLLDDCETSGPVGEEIHTITEDGLRKVSAILDRIDALPFEEPGVMLGAGAMLQAAIMQTFAHPPQPSETVADTDAIAKAIAFSGEIKERRGWDDLLPETRKLYRDKATAALRALKSDDAPSPGRAVSSVAPAAWQPIKTAPKDGSWIIVCVVENGTAYRPSVGIWDFEREAWSDGLNCGEWPVTHWMPLPPPPQETNDDH